MNSNYVWMSSEKEADTYMQSPGHWIVANIEQQIGWTEKKVIVKFQEHNLLLLPEEDDQYPAVAVHLNSVLTEDDARKLINNFLSSLAWSESKAIHVAHWSGGSRPFRMGRSRFDSVRSLHFRISYLPSPQDENARLALAFYREAMSLDHIAYSFLSFYKIINLRYKRGDRQKAWIRRTLPSMTDRDAIKRMEELNDEHEDVADYLYISCRCAIAHAGVSPTVDPENFDDNKRLRSDLPLIKHLAEMLIEEHYEIKTSSTIWKEHLYELDGFKEVLGAELVEKFKNKGTEFKRKVKTIDEISIRLWSEDQYKALENLKPTVVRTADGIILLECVSENDLVSIMIGLDFSNERLLFDPINGVASQDDGSVEAAEFAADVQRFIGKYFCNGSLEVWDPINEKCLGRCDPFIPTNIDLGKTYENYQKAEEHCLQIAKERKKENITNKVRLCEERTTI